MQSTSARGWTVEAEPTSQQHDMKRLRKHPSLRRATIAVALFSIVLVFAPAAFAVPGNGNGPPSGFPGRGNGPPDNPGSGTPGTGNGPGQQGGGSTAGNTVPEPSTILLSLAALGVLLATRRR